MTWNPYPGERKRGGRKEILISSFRSKIWQEENKGGGVRFQIRIHSVFFRRNKTVKYWNTFKTFFLWAEMGKVLPCHVFHFPSLFADRIDIFGEKNRPSKKDSPFREKYNESSMSRTLQKGVFAIFCFLRLSVLTKARDFFSRKEEGGELQKHHDSLFLSGQFRF